ncbi:ribosomal RNA small subunit methyltransferase B [Kushneria pakistanensis]|uniref:16S rRNA (cytosine(967)-C(5))-methyltransferase n=1 Tax=Kushneria pakistanensis TaxID=1508770 RepID=A0ABQ3F8R1_9GAMM|nr:16S rRNA (cytosine(967)-C(5))-methyltransferase RsmB [Kushneria pakistanensis]GHC14281.1 ribosomal RNA small subunit methyltransferase B [Kushneria pakistanensis]
MTRQRPQKPKRTMGVRAHAALALAPVLNQRGALSGDVPEGVAPRDQGLYRALCFGVCRALPQLEALAERLLKSAFKQRDQDIHALLLIGLYQLYHMRIPAHAAVGETAGGARELNKEWATRVINGCLRRADRERDTLLADVEKTPAAAHWHPQWLLTLLQQSWPEQWRDIVTANNTPGPMTLRVNRRHQSRTQWLERLEGAGLAARPCPFSPDGLTLETPCDVEQLPGFQDGDVSVQDEAAQLAASLLLEGLKPHPASLRLLDACSAPGGKSAHLLECAPDSTLTALDSDATRLERVRETLARLNLSATLVAADATTDDWWDGVPFDGILLDAPCSGTGVIRRHPDIKALRREKDIAELAALQARLLDAQWQRLAPGGRLLYATCSVLPAENAEQITAFLARTPEARALPITADWGKPSGEGRQLMPTPDGHDGFFYALLEKAAN